MIGNEVKNQQTAGAQKGRVTSPISKSGKKDYQKNSNGFIAWLRDDDVVDENGGKIDGKTAIVSYIKGLAEIVKTLYKKPFACALTIAAGVVLSYGIGYNALVTIMGFAIVAGSAGILYAGYNLIRPTSSNNTKQAYEVLGISTFVLALGIYGLNF